jgi:regulatory protein
MTCRGNEAVFNMVKEITDLTRQKNDSNRVNVFIDGSFSFGVSRNSGVSLRVGQKISEKEIIELINNDSFEKAFQSALHFLSFRNRSENDVRLNLTRKGFFENDIIKVVDSLKSRGYLDDGNFAKEWVENRSALKPRGRRLLAYELKQKKVNSDMIAVALQGLPNESVLALKAARKIVLRYEKMEFDIFNKKVTGFLIRRGFDFEDIREARKILWEEVQQKIDR